MMLKRWLTHLMIAVYVGALFWGVASHALKFGTGAHPIMYFLVWDMFTGWSSYELRFQIIAEGESGKFYELAPAPWGEIQPFGNIGRRHYDSTATYSGKFALNCLRHTRHEPITQIFVIEECWAKKYNLPDRIWERRFSEPKDIKKYYNVRYVLSPEGFPRQQNPNWLSQQYAFSLANNPRLHAEAARHQPFFNYQFEKRTHAAGDAPGFLEPEVISSPLGN